MRGSGAIRHPEGRVGETGSGRGREGQAHRQGKGRLPMGRGVLVSFKINEGLNEESGDKGNGEGSGW